MKLYLKKRNPICSKGCQQEVTQTIKNDANNLTPDYFVKKSQWQKFQLFTPKVEVSGKEGNIPLSLL